jgi:hypothetical protein
VDLLRRARVSYKVIGAAASVRVHAVEEYYRASEAGFRHLLRTPGYREDELGRLGLELIVGRTVDAIRKSVAYR